MQMPGLPETESPEVRPTRFSHIVLQTGKFEEMAVDVFDKRDEARAWLKSGRLMQSPVGCYVDPEHLAARKRRGEADADIFEVTGQGGSTLSSGLCRKS